MTDSGIVKIGTINNHSLFELFEADFGISEEGVVLKTLVRIAILFITRTSECWSIQ